MTKLNILRCMISAEKNTIDNREAIEAQIKTLNDLEFEKPPNYDEPKREYRKQE